MEYISLAQTWLTDTFGPLGPLYAIGSLGVFLVLLTLPIFLNARKDPLDKLKESQHQPSTLENGQSLRHRNSAEKFDKYAKFLEPEDEGEYSATRLKLLQAGYRSKSAVRTYNFAQVALGAGVDAQDLIRHVIRLILALSIYRAEALLWISGKRLKKLRVTKADSSAENSFSGNYAPTFIKLV